MDVITDVGNVAMRPISKSLEDVRKYQNQRVVERHAADRGVSLEIAQRRFDGLKEFLVVCAAMPGPKITSAEIDAMWHTFLLFTREYRGFCEDYLGRFINHEPFEHPNPHTYLTTRACAEMLVGELDATLWPLTGKADCTSGCDD